MKDKVDLFEGLTVIHRLMVDGLDKFRIFNDEGKEMPYKSAVEWIRKSRQQRETGHRYQAFHVLIRRQGAVAGVHHGRPTYFVVYRYGQSAFQLDTFGMIKDISERFWW